MDFNSHGIITCHFIISSAMPQWNRATVNQKHLLAFGKIHMLKPQKLMESKSPGGKPGTCILHIFKMFQGDSDIGWTNNTSFFMY